MFFRGRDQKIIIIPASFEKGGVRCFRDCKNLKSVTFEEGCTYVGSEMFKDCVLLEKVTFAGTITLIESSAFYGCESLTEVILPIKLKKFSAFAFAECDSLIELVIPYGVEEVTDMMSDCENLKGIYVPDTVKKFMATE